MQLAREIAPMKVNKQTTKIVQDGVELTWDQQQDGELDAEAAAKFYVDSVKALQKFKDEDPRTQPELRKEKKLKDQLDRTRYDWTRGLWVGIVLTAFFFLVFRGCSEPSSDYPHSHYRR